MAKGIKEKVLLLIIAALFIGNSVIALSDDYLEFTKSYEPIIPDNSYRGLVNKKGKETKNKEITPEIEKVMNSYVSVLNKYMKQQWKPPRLTANHSVVIRFSITRDGTIYNPIIFKTSGNKYLDISAVEAVNKTKKYEPLPAIFPREAADILMTFDYHAL